MEACFQFFFSSKEERLPYPEVPTRDVTNAWRQGHKTEPHFERMMENWCPCRAPSVRGSVLRALDALNVGSRHCMILTTNHPHTNQELAVGVLYFSAPGYNRAVARFPGRWSRKKYLPYVGSSGSKLVSFKHAFRLHPWMIANRKHLPGKRYGIVYADSCPDLVQRIVDHFAGAADQIQRFLINVRHLERRLKRDDPKAWKDYWNRKQGISYNSSTCSVSAIRTARC
jgi:hypothetical protein